MAFPPTNPPRNIVFQKCHKKFQILLLNCFLNVPKNFPKMTPKFPQNALKMLLNCYQNALKFFHEALVMHSKSCNALKMLKNYFSTSCSKKLLLLKCSTLVKDVLKTSCVFSCVLISSINVCSCIYLK